jgi:hypothetical protein
LFAYTRERNSEGHSDRKEAIAIDVAGKTAGATPIAGPATAPARLDAELAGIARSACGDSKKAPTSAMAQPAVQQSHAASATGLSAEARASFKTHPESNEIFALEECAGEQEAVYGVALLLRSLLPAASTRTNWMESRNGCTAGCEVGGASVLYVERGQLYREASKLIPSARQCKIDFAHNLRGVLDRVRSPASQAKVQAACVLKKPKVRPIDRHDARRKKSAGRGTGERGSESMSQSIQDTYQKQACIITADPDRKCNDNSEKMASATVVKPRSEAGHAVAEASDCPARWMENRDLQAHCCRRCNRYRGKK